MPLLCNSQGYNFKLLLGNFWIQHSENCNLTVMSSVRRQQGPDSAVSGASFWDTRTCVQLCLGRCDSFQSGQEQTPHSHCSEEPSRGCILTRTGCARHGHLQGFIQSTTWAALIGLWSVGPDLVGSVVYSRPEPQCLCPSDEPRVLFWWLPMLCILYV